ncbi:MAG: DNA polymerase III subunit alpha [Acidimicrobiia bacterium]|nr:DNA polymerase III subunit alpha [Acidimicrobiia bacterium]
MQTTKFVHLHLHTDYSLLDGACEIDTVLNRMADLKMPAAAITDHGNLFGAVGFYETAKKKGIKPIIGCEVYVARGSHTDRSAVEGEKANHHLVLLCENNTGYKNLVKLVSHGYLQGFYYKPRIDKELLAKHSDGLICLSACLSGEVCSNLVHEQYDAARRAAGDYLDIFGRDRFFIEIQDQGLEVEHRINPQLIQLSKEMAVPMVATNDCHYVTREDSRAHEVLLCIQTGKTMSDNSRMRFSNDQFYVKTQEEMVELFRDLPDALSRTLEIADRCNFSLEKASQPFPNFEVPGGKSLAEYFEEVVWQGYEERLPYLTKMLQLGQLRHPLGVYQERLAREIAIIKQMQFPGYFMIVWDFIRYARQHHIPVGPGRGSAAGSLVSYCLRITDVDPIQYGLLFERFLNPQRISMPDIDIDFCTNRRSQVINYVTQKYGRENVSQIITFGTMAAKAAVKDVGRAMDMPYAEVDRIAKLIPSTLNIDLKTALKESDALRDLIVKDPRVKDLFDVAQRLEGMARHASTHAAGVVISPAPLTGIVPLYKSNKDEITTQFPMNDLEKIGLLKMDFLALTTLTVLDDAIRLIKEAENADLALDQLPMDDAKTYEIFAKGLANGIFQFESGGMKDILRRFKPEKLEDLTALNALYRPGPIGGGMIDDFIKRKHGEKRVTYDLPELKEILQETLGVIVYQEQVQQIANRLAGYSLGEGDILRRAMGKKKPEEMAAQRQKFIDGAKAKGFDEKKVAKIFDLMEQFAGYGFNKSHSAAYALLAYQTAYLKAHYPVCFMSALLTSEISNTDKIVKYINECRDMAIKILPPDVNISQLYFTPAGADIRFGLLAIKNVGENAIRSILDARQKVGSFRSIFEFCEQVELRVVNKRVIESLIKAGALDSLGHRRSQLFAVVDKAIEGAQKAQRDRDSGQQGLFGLTSTVLRDSQPGYANHELPNTPEWDEALSLSYEKETLGFYITGHPLAKYAADLNRFSTSTTESLADLESGAEISLGGILTQLKPLKTKKGDRMAVIQLEDLTGSIEAVIFPDPFQRFEKLLKLDAPLLTKGILDVEDSGTRKIRVSDIQAIEGLRERMVKSVVVHVNLEQVASDTAERLLQIIDGHRGEATVIFELEHPKGYLVTLRPNQFVRVKPSAQLVQDIESLCGAGAVKF